MISSAKEFPLIKKALLQFQIIKEDMNGLVVGFSEYMPCFIVFTSINHHLRVPLVGRTFFTALYINKSKIRG